ncbi:hypothetical protein LPJ72_004247, partial [Coemansia sp. Benny D160-2]
MQHQHITFNVQDVGQIWPRIEKEFRARLPLRNLIWKGGITQTARFVEQLNVKVSVAGETEETKDSDKEIMSATVPSLATNPLLNIYLLETLETDAVDMYKSVIRPRVKNWVSKVTQRKGEEWVIVYLPNAAEIQRMATTTKFLNMRASVFDKLKSDFQTKKDTDRVIMLRPDMIESWNATFLALKDRTVQALEDQVGSMAEEIRHLDSNRMMPGWNYCKFFIVKEGLVTTYRLMGLHAEALAQYDELEAVYFELLNSHRLSWFSKFGGGQPGDDFTDLLDDKRKPYHKQMAENSITVFDFRIYLFGRQCHLLIDMGDYKELIVRAQRFVSSFSQSMREPGTGLSLSFVASWTYSICQNIVEICEGFQVTQTPVDRSQSRNAATVATTRMLAASKAEFLTNARQQLDILGTLYDRLPPTYLRRSNTCISLPTPLLRSPSESDKNEKKDGGEDAGDGGVERRDASERFGPYADGVESITNPVLTEALASDERFDQIYVRTCEQATQYYLECGRRRFAQVMRGDIAQLYISRQHWADAVRVLAPLLPATDGSAGSLGIMDMHLFERMAVCEQELGNTAKCLDYVMCLVSHSQYLDASSRETYTDMLVGLAGRLEQPMQIRGASALFAITDVRAVDREDTLCLEVAVDSAVPRAIRELRIEALLIGGSGVVEGSQIDVVLDADGVVLEPGSNTVHLTTDSVSCAGRLVVRSVTIHMANLAFPVIVSNPNLRRFVRLNEHPAAPVFVLRAATVVDREKPSRLRLDVLAHAMPVDAGMRVWLFDDTGRPLLTPRCATTLGSDAVPINEADGALLLSRPVEPNSAISLDVLFDKQLATMRVTVYAEFHSCGHPRMVLDSDVVDFSPPLTVSGHVEAVLAGKHAVVLRVQSRSVDPVRVDSLRVVRDTDTTTTTTMTDGNEGCALWEKMATRRGYMQLGDAVTVVREYNNSNSSGHSGSAGGDSICLQTEVAFTTVLDTVGRAVHGKLDQLLVEEAAEYEGLRQHRRYIGRLVMAHIRATIDCVTTAREARLVCAPLAPLWAAASAYGAPALQKAMRRLFSELSEVVVGGELTADDAGGDDMKEEEEEDKHSGRVLRMALALEITRKYAAVSVSLGEGEGAVGRFCHVFEPVALTVSVTLVAEESHSDATSSRLLVTLVPRDPGDWMIAGPVSQETASAKQAGGTAVMHYTLVPLEVGYLQLPDVE